MRRREVVRSSMKKRRYHARFACALLLALGSTGCLGSTDPSGDAPCTITITGASAIAGTYACSQRAVTIWAVATNAGVVSLNISGPKSITGVFAFPGEPKAGAT